jgi:hypothetical protein
MLSLSKHWAGFFSSLLAHRVLSTSGAFSRAIPSRMSAYRRSGPYGI